MNVILDTNIYLDHYFLVGPKFESLFEYLKNKDSVLLMPEIIKGEILRNYSKSLSEYYQTKNRDEKILFNKTYHNDRTKIGDLEKKYKNTLVKIIKFKNIRILSSKKFSLEKIIERSLNETPPFRTEGRGFKDTLIWLSILDELKHGDKDLCFISKNSKDFGEGQLAAKLYEETKGHNNKFSYYHELEDFLSKNSKPIKEFVSQDKIDDFVYSKELFGFISGELQNKFLGESYDVGSIDEMDIAGLGLADSRVIHEKENDIFIEFKLRLNMRILTSETIHDDGEEMRVNENAYFPDAIVSFIAVKKKNNNKLILDKKSFEFQGFFKIRRRLDEYYSISEDGRMEFQKRGFTHDDLKRTVDRVFNKGN